MRWFALIIALAGCMTMTNDIKANPPPAYGGYEAGWGMNPTNWEQAGGSFTSGLLLYDPTGASPGWVCGWNPVQALTPPAITLELWVEMNMVCTYEHTSYQWHRLGNQGEWIIFVIQGTTSSNNGLFARLVPQNDPLTYLKFREDIFGNPGGSWLDRQLSWCARWGDGLVYGQNVQWGWTYIFPDPVSGALSMGPIPDCDHWFEFKGCFRVPYHQADGYYSLTFGSTLEPAL